jgi:hypothetical protein
MGREQNTSSAQPPIQLNLDHVRRRSHDNLDPSLSLCATPRLLAEPGGDGVIVRPSILTMVAHRGRRGGHVLPTPPFPTTPHSIIIARRH